MARHTAKSHKIRKVEILVIQIIICKIAFSIEEIRRIHMRKLSELQQEIESVRFELDQALLRQDKFDNYYQKSTKLDQLIEEYIEETERSK